MTILAPPIGAHRANLCGYLGASHRRPYGHPQSHPALTVPWPRFRPLTNTRILFLAITFDTRYFLHEIARQEYDDHVTPVMISALCAAGLSCEDVDDTCTSAIQVAASNADPRVKHVMEQIEFNVD